MRIQTVFYILFFVVSLLVVPALAENTEVKFKETLLLAEQGDPVGQYNLAVMYDKGEGVSQDYKEAYAWFNLGAAQGKEFAKKGRDLVDEKLDPASLSEAQNLSKKYYKNM